MSTTEREEGADTDTRRCGDGPLLVDGLVQERPRQHERRDEDRDEIFCTALPDLFDAPQEPSERSPRLYGHRAQA
jgi:hypothetical protein